MAVKINHPDTSFLKFIAIVLVVNSHMHQYYPVSAMATGGSLGISLFFVLSSFGLYLSYTQKRLQFSEWYMRRIRRVYPSMWVVVILLMLPIWIYENRVDSEKAMLFLGNLFYPPFWFLQVLMPSYFIGFFLLGRSKKILLTVFGLFGVAYIGLYCYTLDLSNYVIELPPFNSLFYLGMFIFGILLSRFNDKIKYGNFLDVLLWAASIVVIYGHKYLMVKGLFANYQFIQHLMLFPFVFYSLKIARIPLLQKTLFKNDITASIIKYGSDRTLEIFMVQGLLLGVILKLHIPFPYNAIILFISILLVVEVVYRVKKRLEIAIFG